MAEETYLCHWYLIRAATRRFVWESKGKISFGPNRSRWDRFDTAMVRWQTENPAEYAATIPVCTSCGASGTFTRAAQGLSMGI